MRGLAGDGAVGIDRLVLDAQGVVFNNPWRSFLDDLAAASGRSRDAVHDLWYDVLHDDAWTGALSEDDLWRRLAGDGAAALAWSANLEARYEPGPVAARLPAWRRRVPIWMLSNHRSSWLRSRLDRFGLLGHFDRVLVSDAIGAMKPDPRAFGVALDEAGDPASVLFVDDQPRHVDAARRLGMRSIVADAAGEWLEEVDGLIAARPAARRRGAETARTASPACRDRR